jgi:hypothetical protein
MFRFTKLSVHFNKMEIELVQLVVIALLPQRPRLHINPTLLSKKHDEITTGKRGHLGKRAIYSTLCLFWFEIKLVIINHTLNLCRSDHSTFYVGSLLMIVKIQWFIFVIVY